MTSSHIVLNNETMWHNIASTNQTALTMAKIYMYTYRKCFTVGLFSTLMNNTYNAVRNDSSWSDVPVGHYISSPRRKEALHGGLMMTGIFQKSV